MRGQILSFLRRAIGTNRLQNDLSALRAEMEAYLAPYRAWQPDQIRAEALEAGRIAAHRQTQGMISALLNAARPGSFMHLELNGAPLDLPVETLRTMFHCIHVRPDRSLLLLVETAHLNWMLDRLAPGGTFLDVGASTGATALPAAHRFGSQVRVIAYEPATAARGLLEATVTRNGITHLEVRPFAVSDTAGEAEFREYLPDETGQTPWMPETSSLVASVMPDLPSRMAHVRVVTLDEQMAEAGGFPGPVVVKIDVEGFEAFVLRGAAELIRIARPCFSIDIHRDPFAADGSSTEAAVRAVLAPVGYHFTTMGHVLLCEPG
jgi:FkbM family methyltransferase